MDYSTHGTVSFQFDVNVIELQGTKFIRLHVPGIDDSELNLMITPVAAYQLVEELTAKLKEIEG